MTSPGPRIIEAPAKINLALAVAAPDGSGMHPIASWMAPINLCDTVRIERLDEGERRRLDICWAADAPRPSPIDWPPEKDLAARACAALEEKVGRSLPAAVTIEKRIPVGAGLAGGSSDAAAALIGMRSAHELELADSDLRAIAGSLGSDIAFFCPPGAGAAAFVAGLGERIERIETPAAELLLICPPFGCNTGSVYRAYDDAPARRFREDEIRALAAGARIETNALFNDLADAAVRVAPELGALRARAVEVAKAPVHITGSGSGMFVVDPGPRLERALADALPECAVLRVRVREKGET